MISRTLAMPALLAASVAVPYVATNAPEWTEKSAKPVAAAPAVAPTPGSSVADGAVTHLGAIGAATNSPSPGTPAVANHLGGAPTAMLTAPNVPPGTYALAEVLRFDVTKEWVYQRWDRKSTALADLELFGVRVPLVSGTQVHDIAGSLTYFFGADGRAKRISFRGRTGDTTQLAMLLHQRFGLQAAPSVIAGQQLLQLRQGNDVISEMRTQTAPILWSNSPHESFSVEFELQDPAVAKPLKQQAPSAATVATPPPATPVANGASSVDPAVAAKAAEAEAEAKATAAAKAEKKSDEQSPALGWKALFPRSRIPAGQVDHLNRSNYYQ